jgi:signal transduction histidine kinase
VSLLVFSSAAISLILSNLDALTWREWTAAALCLGQAGLYIGLIAFGGWPLARWRIYTYFGLGLAMWVVACWLNPLPFWLGFTYFGQMYGLLSPVMMLPGTAAVLALTLFIISDWQVARIPLGAAIGFGFAWVSGASIYVLIFNISRTSEERAKLITQLEAAKHQLEAARERDAELAALRERERLARDLHDSLGHALVALSVQLEAVQRLYKIDPERASAQIDELKTLTRTSMEDLRRSLDGLRAPGLGDQPLRTALQSMCVETGQRLKAEVNCSITGEVDGLTPVMAETIWRATQEALTNVSKHANAHRVDVTLTVRGESVTLKIADDGPGFRPGDENRPGHYGLRGMRERVEGLGGTLRLAKGDGGLGGAAVEINLPLIAQ